MFTGKLAPLAIVVVLTVQVPAATLRFSNALPANAVSGDFTASTVAKKYNFRFTGSGNGSGSHGTVLSAIGWFEADDSGEPGNIFDGFAELSVGDSTGAASRSLTLSRSTANRILVKDATNGIYDIRLKFGPPGEELVFDARVIFDDVRGRNGKVSGVYVFFPIQSIAGGGPLSGEITARVQTASLSVPAGARSASPPAA